MTKLQKHLLSFARKKYGKILPCRNRQGKLKSWLQCFDKINSQELTDKKITNCQLSGCNENLVNEILDTINYEY